MLTRLLSWLLLPLLAWLAWRWLKALRKRHHGQHDGQPRPAGEALVACTHCGLRLPQSEAVARNGMFFCCPEHRDEHPPDD